MPEIPIFCISLNESAARFANVERSLSRFGLTPIRVRAINGRRKSELLRRSTQRSFFSAKHNRPMSSGEIGCLVSHIKAIRTIMYNRLPAAIITEDDVEFSPQFGEFYRNDLLDFLDVADIVKIEGDLYAHSSRDGLTCVRGSVCRGIIPMRPSLCAAAYAVTLSGAESLASVADSVDEPFDFILNSYERYRARYCELRPFLGQQSGVTSTIGEAGRSHDAVPKGSYLTAQMVHKAFGRFTNAGSTMLRATTKSCRKVMRMPGSRSFPTRSA